MKQTNASTNQVVPGQVPSTLVPQKARASEKVMEPKVIPDPFLFYLQSQKRHLNLDTLLGNHFSQ